MLKSQTLNQKHWGFFIMFSIVQFHLEIVSANMTLTNQSTIICLKHIYIYGKQCNVISVENILKRNKNHGTLAKMQLNFFGDFFSSRNYSLDLTSQHEVKMQIFCFVFCTVSWELAQTLVQLLENLQKTYNLFYKRLLI